MAYTDSVKAPLARLAFENLLVPGKKTDAKTKKEVDHWNCNLLWPKTTDLSALKALVVEAAVQEWGDKAKDLLNAGTIKNPFLDGDGPAGCKKSTGERWSGFEGMTFARVGSNQRPKMVTKAVEPVTSKEELYAGCYVYAVLNAYTWSHPTNGRGVSLGLSMLQVVKDGERLGGAPADPSAFFERIDDEGEAPPATKSGDGAAGLFG